MAVTNSAKQQLAKSLARRQRNRARKSSMRTWVKRTVAAVEAQDLELAEKNLVEAFKHIDKNAKWHQVHPNTAARRKARLSRLVNGLRQASK